ncbi:troponin I 3-like [Papaver somniferum]|nr:troponin I 3-like [Papaver somniferum]
MSGNTKNSHKRDVKDVRKDTYSTNVNSPHLWPRQGLVDKPKPTCGNKREWNSVGGLAAPWGGAPPPPPPPEEGDEEDEAPKAPPPPPEAAAEEEKEEEEAEEEEEEEEEEKN